MLAKISRMHCLGSALLLLCPIAAAAAPAGIPWQAAATTETQSIPLTVRSGDATLSGTLHLPRTGPSLPAVIAFHPASSPTRDARMFAHLVDTLPPIGIAVFIFDRRSEGASSGSPARGDYERLAADGIAIRKAIAAHPRIDAKRTGYWGLSQGGWLAVMAASRDPEAAFAISVSAPVTPPDVQMNFAVANILRIKGVPDTEIDIALEARRAVDDFMRGKIDRPTAQRALDRAADHPWFEHIYMSRSFADPARSGWAKELRHDPMKTLRANSAPTLLIFGSRDPWIPVEASARLLAQEQANRPNWDVAVIADADHAMMTSAAPAQQIDPKNFGTQGPEAHSYIATMASWLTKLGMSR